MIDKYSVKRQTLKLGEVILKEIYPNARFKILAGLDEPDLVVEDHQHTYLYDMKFRSQNYDDILIELGSLFDDGRFSLGWLFKHPDWWTLYVFEISGSWYAWQNRDIISLIKSGPLSVRSLIPSRKHNDNYTTLSIALSADVLDCVPTWIAGNWKTGTPA